MIRRAWSALRRGLSAVSWYVKEVVGENRFQHYQEAYERRHGTLEGSMCEKEFWRDVVDEQDRNPKTRCC